MPLSKLNADRAGAVYFRPVQSYPKDEAIQIVMCYLPFLHKSSFDTTSSSSDVLSFDDLSTPVLRTDMCLIDVHYYTWYPELVGTQPT